MERIVSLRYLDCKVLMIESTGYINVTRMCEENNKKFDKWLKKKENREYIKFLKSKLGMRYSQLIIDHTYLTRGQGKYAHRHITIRVAQWISNELAFNVSMAMNDSIHKDSKIQYLLEEVKRLRIADARQSVIIENQKILIDNLLRASGTVRRVGGDSSNPERRTTEGSSGRRRFFES